MCKQQHVHVDILGSQDFDSILSQGQGLLRVEHKLAVDLPEAGYSVDAVVHKTLTPVGAFADSCLVLSLIHI